MNCQRGLFSALLGLLPVAALLFSAVPDAASQTTANPHGDISISCETCHTSEGWTKLRANLAFDHGKTVFPLTGRHTTVSCRSCHASPVFAQAGTRCSDCHLDIHRGQFADACEQCHTTSGWNDLGALILRHEQTRFPLTGVHANLDCRLCHSAEQYAGLSTECVSCHARDFAETKSPNHTAAGFTANCSDCHTTVAAGWRTTRFDHPASFVLTGAHKKADCIACHSQGFSGTSPECFSCHQADFAGAEEPDHTGSAFSHNCAACHSTVAWEPASFNHWATDFPLTGAHTTLACALCHPGGHYAGTSSECFSCHEAVYQSAGNPNHVQGGYSHACGECHSAVGWQPANFDHQLTGFPLTGAHVTAACAQCHLNGQFSGTPVECVACHQAEYDNTTEPNHAVAGYPTGCGMCHTVDGWHTEFNHTQTAFPLVGQHANASCSQCHANGQFQGTPTDCFACHESDYQQSANPVHDHPPFTYACADCHNSDGWQPAQFDHNQASFQLTGAHVSLECVQCHVGNQYSNTPSQCVGCHQSNYDGSQEPNHAAAGFSTDCSSCHTTADWNAAYDHSTTGYTLTGAHLSANCTQCHVNNVYSGTASDCYACHQTNYEQAANPNHVTNQFSHQCADCHTTTAWEPASFDHSQTTFPLTGAHVSASCLQCHINGQFTGTPTDCFFCHQTDYQQANNPNHAAAGFPTTCATCHSTNNWNATFDHDGPYFPIYSGHHQGTWNTCSECHPNAANFAEFTCISCHAHRQSEMDQQHDEVSGYSYNSQACFNCHPRGDSGDRTQIRRSNDHRR